MQSPETPEQAPDFKKIFREVLDSVEPLSDEDARGLAFFYKDAGITEVRKEVPVILFSLAKERVYDPTDIWIANPKDLKRKSGYIHDQVEQKLNQFLGVEYKAEHYQYSITEGYILEDKNGELYLVLDNLRAEDIKTHKESKIEYEKVSHMNFIDLLNRYGISRVLEKASRREIVKKQRARISTSEDVAQNIIDKNMLEERREALAMINLAQKHKMTNNQYMRLKILADTLHKAGQQVSLDEIAKSIVKDKEGVGIDVKHLPLEDKSSHE